MTNRLDNVRRLYLDGIRDGNAREAVLAYTGARYTQHSTGVADDVEGFMAFFEPFLLRNPRREIEIVRAIEDGSYVFVHAYQRLNDGESEWVTTDLFDTDENDLLIEHWDTITPFTQESATGHSQIGGQTEVIDLGRTADNKQSIRDLFDNALQNGGRLDLASELSSEQTYEEVVHLIGQGNFVVTYSRASKGADAYAVFDVFRLENGLIVEHWDNAERIAPRAEWNNSGKF